MVISFINLVCLSRLSKSIIDNRLRPSNRLSITKIKPIPTTSKYLIFLDYLTELNEWGPVFTLWSNSEDKLNHALVAMAKAVEKCFLSLQQLVSLCL